MSKKVTKFKDIESGEIITIEQLFKEYEQAMKSREYDTVEFSWYVWNCLTINNGTLVEIK